jgi:hypothetical protein
VINVVEIYSIKRNIFVKKHFNGADVMKSSLNVLDLFSWRRYRFTISMPAILSS